MSDLSPFAHGYARSLESRRYATRMHVRGARRRARRSVRHPPLEATPPYLPHTFRINILLATFGGFDARSGLDIAIVRCRPSKVTESNDRATGTKWSSRHCPVLSHSRVFRPGAQLREIGGSIKSRDSSQKVTRISMSAKDGIIPLHSYVELDDLFGTVRRGMRVESKEFRV